MKGIALLTVSFVILLSTGKVSAATQTTIQVGVRGTMQADLFEPDGQGPARRLAGILGGVNAPYQMQLYPATGHSFDRGGSTPQLGVAIAGRATHGAARSGGGDAAAATDAWTRTLAFFRKYL